MMISCLNRAKLALWVVMSSLWLISAAAAHEVQPAVGDVSVVDGQVMLSLTMNAEAALAGIDLDGVTDTDAVTEGTSYVAFRAMEGEALAGLMMDSDLAQRVQVLVDGTPVALRIETAEVPGVGDTELPRLSMVKLTGDLPEGAMALQIGWESQLGVLILRQQGVVAPFDAYLSGGALSESFAISGGDQISGWQAFVHYIPVGFEHIVPLGLDHILFVLALFFLSARMSTLLWQVSAFTLAHTVTLALGALGLVNVPGSIVEPIIAASIVFVAVENMLSDRLNKWRPAVIFGFGLLHGLGFASVLGDFGLPEGNFIPALIGFNIGVELGQLAVIAAAFLAVGLWFGKRDWYRRVIAIPASLAIAIIGAYWFVERVFL